MSKIQWTDRTWNPVRGCSRVSSGCANCHAENLMNPLCPYCPREMQYIDMPMVQCADTGYVDGGEIWRCSVHGDFDRADIICENRNCSTLAMGNGEMRCSDCVEAAGPVEREPTERERRADWETDQAMQDELCA